MVPVCWGVGEAGCLGKMEEGPLFGRVAVARGETQHGDPRGEAGTVVQGRERPGAPGAEGLKEGRLWGYQH